MGDSTCIFAFFFVFFFIKNLRDVPIPDEESTINLLACTQGTDYGTIMYFSFACTFGECSQSVTVNFVFIIGEFHGTFLYLKCCWFKPVLGHAFFVLKESPVDLSFRNPVMGGYGGEGRGVVGM